MAIDTLNESASARVSQAAEAIHPTGYLCDNWLSFEANPALSLNPKAQAGELVAWCWAEVRALHTTARAVTMLFAADHHALSSEDLGVLFLNRLRPLEEVLEHVASRLDQERRQQP